MKISALFFMPTVSVLGVAGWACWQMLPASDQAPAAKAKSIEIGARLLRPDLGSSRKRDPFRLPGDPPHEMPKVMGGAEPIKVAAAPKPQDVRAEAETRSRAKETLAGLKLGATSVHQGLGVAIINGRAYAAGEALEAIDPALGKVILAEIYAGEVMLLHMGSRIKLAFPEASAASAGTPPAPAAAKARPRRPRSTASPSMKGKPR